MGPSPRTRCKICGITCWEDASFAIECGADALGYMFYSQSPRYIEPESAAELIRRSPPFVTQVGLFVDAGADAVRKAIEVTGIDVLQFHGEESDDFCRQFGRRYFKVVRAKPGLDLGQVAAAYPGACGIMFDAYQPGVPGGTGQRFDWSRVPATLDKPMVLAGGLTPANVAQAIQEVRPWGVDVSSGVEATKRRKDPDKLQAFFAAIQQVNRQVRAP